MSTFLIVNYIGGAMFLIIYIYQFYFVPVSIFRRAKVFPNATPLRYAVLICARNEEAVIGCLIDSIHVQNYPQDMIDIFVIADNCTDETAMVARKMGAHVVERYDMAKVGKGYALEYLLNTISGNGTSWEYEGYFIIDSDNLLDENFVKEMNRAIAAGNKIVTSYRNSKNHNDNWLAASYALWFLRESKYLNNSREALGLSSQCSGTGFVIHREIFEKYGGWNYFTLTEDVEFTFAMIAAGEHIAFCPSAIIYDEQPSDWRTSWNQRVRWVKGYFQSYRIYGGALLKRLFKCGDFSCFDMLVNTFAGAVITLGTFLFYVFGLCFHAALMLPPFELLQCFGLFLGCCYGGFYILGLITTITEWNQIYCPSAKKIRYSFTFPLFLLTLIPIAIWAIFSKQRWPQVTHKHAINIRTMQKENK